MKSTTLAVLSALLSTGALAVPTVGHKHAAAHARLHHKRAEDIVWVTEYETELVTVIETVYGDGRPASQLTLTTSSRPTPAANTVVPTTTSSTTSSSVPTAVLAPSSASVVAPVATTTSTTSTTTSTPSTTTSTSTVAPPAPTTVSTTTSEYVAPAPVVSPSSAAASTSSAAAPTTGGYSGGGSTSAGATYTGEFTHYEPGLGACGVSSSDGEAVVAISQTLFNPSTPNGNPNNNPLCGRTLNIVGKDGSTYTAKVVDRCVSCAQGDLDLTMSLFNKVTNNGDGRVGNMKWSWA